MAMVGAVMLNERVFAAAYDAQAHKKALQG
jgi:hypothetical protein